MSATRPQRQSGQSRSAACRALSSTAGHLKPSSRQFERSARRRVRSRLGWRRGHGGTRVGRRVQTLIGHFGLALDNLLAADLVLADGRFVIATHDKEEELFWALRGGGNFGVVTAMHHRLHDLPSVRSGMLIYPFVEARAVLGRCIDVMTSMPEELTVQLVFVAGPDGTPVVLIMPTWCG